MRIALLGLLLCIVLFFAGLFAPRRSRRMQRWVNRQFRRGEGKSQRRAGKLGDWTRLMLQWTRRASTKSAESGRKLNRKGGEAADTIRGALD